MNRFLHRAQTPPVVLATILALGLLMVWVFAWMLGSLFASRQNTREQLMVERDGEVYISRFDEGAVSRRTLDGMPIDTTELGSSLDSRPDAARQAAEAVPLGNGSRTPWRDASAHEWNSRIWAFNAPRTNWYQIHDAQPVGSVYFMGFDIITKLPIGYVGRNGFRPDMPPVEEQFPDVVGSLYHPYPAVRRGREPRGTETSPLVYVISGGKVFGFDPHSRNVERIDLPGDVIAARDYQITDREMQARTLTAFRLSDKVVILDHLGRTIRTVPIPKELQKTAFNLHLCTEAVVIFETGIQPFDYEPHELYWADDNGQVTRRATVRLWTPPQLDPRMRQFAATALVPVPMLIGLDAFVTGPLSNVKIGRSPYYSSALASYLPDAWPALLTLTLLSAVLATFVYRRHRKITDRGAVVWSVFVLLTGLPGLLGYLWHRNWPATEKCPACSGTVPRDRETCLACGAKFPLPAPAGCEIFA